MSPRTRQWIDNARLFIVATATPRSQVDVNSVRKLVEVSALPQPPTAKDVQFVLRSSEFKKAGSVVVEDNGYTSSKLIRTYRVDHTVAAQKLIAAAPVSARTKAFFGCSAAW